MAEGEQHTIPELAIPRSRPSSSVHALHKSLLDIYPQRLHVSERKTEIIFDVSKVPSQVRTDAECVAWL